MSEPDRVRERYARRQTSGKDALWRFLEPSVLLAAQEKERALARWISSCHIQPITERRVLEVGCGTGDDLLEYIRLGFAPEHLAGCELLEDRAETARHRLPAATTVVCGDASAADFEEESFDIVAQSTVFTSLLNDEFQQQLADRMWALARPGGGILWYDFIYDNPQNPDVRGVPASRVRELFAGGEFRSWKVTLAPPIGRRLARIHPLAYSVANWLSPLRIARLCWIAKPH